MDTNVARALTYVLAFCAIISGDVGASQIITTREMFSAIERLEKCLRSDVQPDRRQLMTICGAETYSRSSLDDQLMKLRRFGYKVESWMNIDRNATLFFFRISDDEQIGVCVVRVGARVYVDSVGTFIH